MLFNLNEFLMAVSFALDFVEMDILGVTSNHGKRTALISLYIGSELGFNSEELHDVVALAILHDNGVSEKTLHDDYVDNKAMDVRSIERKIEHCAIGEENVIHYPFLTRVRDVIRYHHEAYDGTGFYKLKGEDIPLMAQIIYMADMIELNFSLYNYKDDLKERVLDFIEEQSNKTFSAKLVDAFSTAADKKEFWTNLNNDYIYHALKSKAPSFSLELSLEEIRGITGVISKIIDAKSKFTQRHSKDLSDKTAVMADYYKLKHDEKMKLIIAADLHDIGKLAVPNTILDSHNKLTEAEFAIVKKHTYYTRLALQEIKGFEDITEWASNHHEKLNGKGYPIGLSAKDLDFNSRLMACLDIYEALTEVRPYRKSLSHEDAMDILNKMRDNEFIDGRIVQDIDIVFGSHS